MDLEKAIKLNSMTTFSKSGPSQAPLSHDLKSVHFGVRIAEYGLTHQVNDINPEKYILGTINIYIQLFEIFF